MLEGFGESALVKLRIEYVGMGGGKEESRLFDFLEWLAV